MRKKRTESQCHHSQKGGAKSIRLGQFDEGANSVLSFFSSVRKYPKWKLQTNLSRERANLDHTQGLSHKPHVRNLKICGVKITVESVQFGKGIWFSKESDTCPWRIMLFLYQQYYFTYLLRYFIIKDFASIFYGLPSNPQPQSSAS